MTVRLTLANKASTDLSAKAGYAVKFDTTGINVCSAATDQAIGIITRGGETESEVCVHGECQALLGAAMTAGKYAVPHTDGTVKDTTSSAQEFALALQSGVASDRCNIYVYGSPLTKA